MVVPDRKKKARAPADSGVEVPGEAAVDSNPGQEVDVDSLDDFSERPKEDVVLPVLPGRETVLYPFELISLTLTEASDLQVIEAGFKRDRLVVLVPVISPGEPRRQADFFHLGCLGRIVKKLRFPDDSIRILIRGVARAKVSRFKRHRGGYFTAQVRLLPDLKPGDSRENLEVNAVARALADQFIELIRISPNLMDDLAVSVYNIRDPARLAYLAAEQLNISFEEKLHLLEARNVAELLEGVAPLINRELVMVKTTLEIQDRVSEVFSSMQRQQFLREQLKAVQAELGQEPELPEIAELRKQVEEADLPPAAREAAEREIKRLRQMHPSSPEYTVARGYIDWLAALPWNRTTSSGIDLDAAAKILDRDHYDLVRVKERILEYLAVLKLRGDMKAPILCFVGPPGVGKTSLGRSIARAMGREFIRMSLGGVHDEAEIRGHRRTYVGALPGRILQGLRRAGAADPVFMLDEVDKLGRDFRGDPSSALLEVLDPEQNHAFSDNYLEVPFDLSRVFFITTANLADPIPAALYDRMEVIRLPGYSQREKHQIARRWLLPRQLKEHGLNRRQVSFRAAALDTVIREYTSEAGVRNLERAIGAVCRKLARKIVEGEIAAEERVVIDPGRVREYLGPPKVFPEAVADRGQVGVATGLAWTRAGGEILQIEVNAVSGKGGMILTGSLGDVMKESAQIAWTYVRSRAGELGFDPDGWGMRDIHLHVPSGATPKDGPSAGVAIATALASLATERPVRARVAMTGEISLRGRVLPVGGVKEKVLAAARSGIRDILLPEKNRGDLEDVPDEVMRKLRFHFVRDAAEVLDFALDAPARPGAEKSARKESGGEGSE